MEGHLPRGRVVNTFTARELQVPDSQRMADSLEKYSLRRGGGLEPRNRRSDKKPKLIV